MNRRTREIRSLLARIDGIGFTPGERLILSWGFSQGLSHNEMAAKLGIKPESSVRSLNRARHRAEKHGVIIPPKRRKPPLRIAA